MFLVENGEEGEFIWNKREEVEEGSESKMTNSLWVQHVSNADARMKN